MDMYDVLVAARKQCTICVNRYRGEIENGSIYPFDPNVVSYWSQWLGNRAPKLVIVANDFSNIKYFKDNEGHDQANNPTNKKLRELLVAARIPVTEAPIADKDAPVYLTNSILCLKEGAMTKQIKMDWVQQCTRHHLVPLVRHLKPPVVVGMGRWGWLAVRLLYWSSLRHTSEKISAVAGNSWTVDDGTVVFAVGHCALQGIYGPKGRRWEDQITDWQRIGERMRRLSGSMPLVSTNDVAGLDVRSQTTSI
jgi:hypothetical protein